MASPKRKIDRRSLFIGADVGAVVALILLIVVQASVGTEIFGVATHTSTTTLTSIRTSTFTVEYSGAYNAYGDHLVTLSSLDIPALVSGYEKNATVVWTGDAVGMAGNYTGTQNITQLFSIFPGHLDNLTLSNETVGATGFEGTILIVHSSFSWAGYSQGCGPVSGTISAVDSYASHSNWQISSETWDWLTFNAQYPTCLGL